MGKLKNKMMKEVLEKPIQVGDRVLVEGQYLSTNHSQLKNAKNLCIVANISEDGNTIGVCNTYNNSSHKVDYVDKTLVEKDINFIGVDPFPKKDWLRNVEHSNRQLEGIIGITYGYDDESFRCGVKTNDDTVHKIPDCNFNPYVFDQNGNKQYYQRDFCWSKKDKQLLIESIYLKLDCGKIVIRKRSYEWMKQQLEKGNTEVAYADMVDGKQRVNAVWEFMHDKFPDLHGVYYSDFSEIARREWCMLQPFSFAELREQATDEDTIACFLNVNFTGKPMSKEHIEYVKEIQNKLNKNE